jgi:hypothetical protein
VQTNPGAATAACAYGGSTGRAVPRIPHRFVVFIFPLASWNVGLSGGDAQQRTEACGHVVRYAPPPPGSYRANVILKLKAGTSMFTKLLYAPQGFGFDAPAARREQLLPDAVFSGVKAEWCFKVHVPQTGEERAACQERQIQLSRDPDEPGPPAVERDAYMPVPGSEREKVPPAKALRFFIVGSWERDGEGDTGHPQSSARHQ